MARARRSVRVAIAKDVIARVKAGKIEPWSGAFVIDLPEASDGDDMRSVMRKHDKPCRACALGGLFLASLERRNGVTYGSVVDVGFSVIGLENEATVNYVSSVFGRDQAKLVEIAFEQGRGYCRDDGEAVTRAEAFGARYDSDTDRLIAIMRNIIRNDGDFVPPRVRKTPAPSKRGGAG